MFNSSIQRPRWTQQHDDPCSALSIAGDRPPPLLLHLYAEISSTYEEKTSFKILFFGLQECLE